MENGKSHSKLINLHNLKVYDPEPSAIHNIAYAPKLCLLALSRADSSIEIWNENCRPRLIRRLVVDEEWSSVEGLAWHGGRLFSCGLHGYVLEHDLQQLCIKSSVAAVSGACWCIDIHSSSTQLAIGTEEGFISLMEINSDGLRFDKILDKQEGRVLCVSWTPDGTRLVSGSQDAVRVWDVQSGHALHRISTGRDDSRRPCIVWCIQCIDNQYFVSGDSRGKLCVWDLQMGVNLETHQALQKDLLCLNVCPDKKYIYCSGIEGLIPIYTKLQKPAAGARTKWMRSYIRRFHTHDVRALVSLGGTKLASGGVDTNLIISDPKQKTMLTYPHLPLKSVCVASSAQLVMTRHSTHLELFPLSDLEEVNAGSQEDPPVLLRLDAKAGHHITCAAISEEANWLTYSTQNKSRFFTLEGTDGSNLVLEKVRTMPRQLLAFSAISFSGKESKKAVVASTQGCILVLGMNHQTASITLSHTINTQEVLPELIHQIRVSADKRFIIAADVAGNTATWSDKGWQRCITLPKHNCEVTAMAVHPNSNNLMLVYADHKLCEYRLPQSTLTDFSRNLSNKPHFFNPSLTITNISFDPEKESGVLFHDTNTIYVIDKYKMVTSEETEKVKQNKRPKKEVGIKSKLQTLTTYKYILHAQWLKRRELCVVRVEDKILEDKLPPAVVRKTYGSHI